MVGHGSGTHGWLGPRTGRILQKDEGLNVLLNIPDSAKVVAFKPEHPGLWSIKVTTLEKGVEETQVSQLGPWPFCLLWGAWGLRDGVGTPRGGKGPKQRWVLCFAW